MRGHCGDRPLRGCGSGASYNHTCLQPKVARLSVIDCGERSREHVRLVDCRSYCKSATAEDGNGKDGQAFAVCAVSRQSQKPINDNEVPMARNRANRKNEGRPKGVAAASAPAQSDCVGNN